MQHCVSLLLVLISCCFGSISSPLVLSATSHTLSSLCSGRYALFSFVHYETLGSDNALVIWTCVAHRICNSWS